MYLEKVQTQLSLSKDVYQGLKKFCGSDYLWDKATPDMEKCMSSVVDTLVLGFLRRKGIIEKRKFRVRKISHPQKPTETHIISCRDSYLQGADNVTRSFQSGHRSIHRGRLQKGGRTQEEVRV